MTGSEKTDYQKLAGQLLLFAYILAIACLYIVPINIVFEPPYLLPVTNTVFTAIIPLAVALIAARAFLTNGSLSLFLMGCGMLGFGISAAFAGWLIRAHDGPNINVTIYNSGALLSSLFHIFGAVLGTLGSSPKWERGREKPIVAAAYAGIAFLVILFTVATFQGVVPTFFIQGSGPTALRQLVLGLSIFFYALSALLFMQQYLKSKQDFLYWYTLCLAMLALGLFAFYIQHQVGGLIGWAGRTANYAGAIFAALAVRSALQSAKSTGVALEHVISGYFTDAEANFRSLVETATDAIVSYDQANRIILWNSGAERMFGYVKAEAIGASFYEEIIPREYSISVAELIATPGKRLDSSRTVEIKAKCKSGELLPVEISAFSRKLPSGSITTCIMRDITERKRSEAALIESKAKLETVIESMNDAVFISDREGNFIDFNDAFVSYHKFRNKQECYKRLSEYPDYIDVYFADGTLAPLDQWAVQRALRGETVPYTEYILRRKDTGETWWGSYSFSPIRDKDGSIVGSVVVGRDITERKQAEEELRKAKNELEERVKERTYELYEESIYARSLIEASLDPLVTISVDGKITDVNHASEEVTGFPREQLIGSDFSEYFTEPGKARVGYEEVFRHGVVRDYPLELKRRDGHVTPVLYNASVYRDDTGRTMGVFAAARDITKRKQAEVAQRRLASELAMAEERERKRIAGVLHDDIAQILAAARMRLDMLQDIPTDQALIVKEAKSFLLQSLQETRALMNDLGNPVLFELGLEAACLALARQMMERHHVRISCDIQDAFEDLNPDVKTILYQVIKELLNNVVKHSQAHNAQLMIDMENGHLRVKVTDDGVGFDPRMLGAPGAEGGFGLYSIRERLSAVDGSLSIESTPGTGTVVTAILPETLD